MLVDAFDFVRGGLPYLTNVPATNRTIEFLQKLVLFAF
jgi:hypothetical protein